jgi:hypothetical protein
MVTPMCRFGTAARRITQQLDGNCLSTRANSTGLVLAREAIVIWFYERKGEHLRCEVRQLIEGDRFALVVTMPDGTERTEVFEDSGALNRRSVELEQMLRTKGWNGPYARDI